MAAGHIELPISTAGRETPLPSHLAGQIRDLILAGIARPGDSLPSSRALASQLGVSRGSITAAYDQLNAEGYLLTKQGAPTRVHPEITPLLPEATAPKPQARIPKVKQLSLRPSTASAELVSTHAWRSAWRTASATPDVKLAPAGEDQLRSAIAQHLRLARAMPVDPQDVFVTGGGREGLMLILMALARRTGRRVRVGVEDPGHPGLQGIIGLLGHEKIACASDEHGVIPEQLDPTLDVLLVTPSHLYPIGASMPGYRRSQLLGWAHKSKTILVEDDYNTELRYRVAPQPTLSARAQGAEVITLGTFSTLLSPSLSAGYVIAGFLHNELLATRVALGMPVAGVTQRAIAELLANGYVRRHTKKMHARLKRRKAKIQESLDCEGIELRAIGEGADCIIEFDHPSRASAFEYQLASQGISIGHADKLWRTKEAGFVLSFAHLDDATFASSLSRVRDALNNVS